MNGYRSVLRAALVAALVSIVAAAGLALGAVASVNKVEAAELVMFEEPGCPWCARWEREVGEAYRNSDEGHLAPLRRMDISQARRSGIRLAAAVAVTPTFVLVEDGAEVGRIVGYPGADFFWGMIGALFARLPSSASGAPIERKAHFSGRQTCAAALACGSAATKG